MKILIDMNLSPDWVPVLEAVGHETVHWSGVGDPSASDRTILTWAAQHDHVVFTHDLDFGAILAATQATKPSVIQLRSQDVLPNAHADVVVRALEQFGTELSNGALITIDVKKAKARILPI